MSEAVAFKRQKKMFSFYDFGKVLSYNAAWNFLVGGRGIGKTYGAKKLVIRDYLRKGAQFIYLRRFKTELTTRTTFFADIAEEFPKYGFRVNGEEAQITREPNNPKPHWETMGFFMALSTAQNRKSVAYPNVTCIIFDEFILEKSSQHYLPQEHVVFTNFFSTVDRYQDKTKVLFLANAVSIQNPYFIGYNILPSAEFVRDPDNFYIAHFIDSNEFANEIRETRFGKFIAGTEYEDYAVNSVFADNHEYLLSRKNAEATYQITLETKQGMFSVWTDKREFPYRYYVQNDLPKKQTIYTLMPEAMSEGKILVDYSDKMMQYLRAAYAQGRVFFDGAQTRNKFIQIYKR